MSCSGSNESEISRILPARSGNAPIRWASSENFLIHQRAKIGQRTSRINKRKNDHVAAQVRELDRLAVLAGHGEVGDRLADLEAPWAARADWAFPLEMSGTTVAPAARLGDGQAQELILSDDPVVLLDPQRPFHLVAGPELLRARSCLCKQTASSSHP